MAKFLCSLLNTQIKGPNGRIQFDNGLYETTNEKEIAFLREYGSVMGCTVKEVKAQGVSKGDGPGEPDEAPEDPRLNAADTVALIKSLQTVAEVEQFLEDDRPTVRKAAEKRIAKLTEEE